MLFASFFLFNSARASYVTNWFGEGNGSTNTITVNFKPTGTPYVLPNGQTIISYAFSVTATNGILAPAWLATGPWTVTFGGSFDTWKLNVPYDSQTYALWQLATNINALSNFPVIYLGNGGGVTAAELAAQGLSMTNWIDDNFALIGESGVTSVAVAADSAGVVSWTGSPDTSTGTFTPTFSKASFSQFGVAKVDNSTITAASGVLSVGNINGAQITSGTVGPAFLQKASAGNLGVVQGDASTISINGSGIISAAPMGTAITNWANASFQPLSSALTTLSGNNGANLTGLVPGGFANFPPNTVLANAASSAAAPTASGTLSVTNVEAYNAWVSNNLSVMANIYGSAAIITNSLKLPYSSVNTVAYFNGSGNLVSGASYSGGAFGSTAGDGTVENVALTSGALTLANAAAYSFLGNNTSSSAAPTYVTTIPTNALPAFLANQLLHGINTAPTVTIYTGANAVVTGPASGLYVLPKSTDFSTQVILTNGNQTATNTAGYIIATVAFVNAMATTNYGVNYNLISFPGVTLPSFARIMDNVCTTNQTTAGFSIATTASGSAFVSGAVYPFGWTVTSQ